MKKMMTIVEFPAFTAQIGASMTLSEQEDLSSEQKKRMTALTKLLKTECKSKRRYHD